MFSLSFCLILYSYLPTKTYLSRFQASPVLCSSLLSRLLPPLISLASRPGAPSSLLSATFPCLELLVRHSSSQTESGRQVLKKCQVLLLEEAFDESHFFHISQVASSVPSLLTTLLSSVSSDLAFLSISKLSLKCILC